VTSQREMFVAALEKIGEGSGDDEQLADHLKMLGQAHRRSGLTTKHMETGREAFVAAIEAGGQGLSDELKQHYLDAFTELEQAMGFDVNVDQDDT
jgi:hypothetical protein